MRKNKYLLGTFSLFAVLAVLKLIGVIAWSWWLVTVPLWLPAVGALCLVIVFFTLIGYYYRK
jgi:hypothetical protein